MPVRLRRFVAAIRRTRFTTIGKDDRVGDDLGTEVVSELGASPLRFRVTGAPTSDVRRLAQSCSDSPGLGALRSLGGRRVGQFLRGVAPLRHLRRDR